MKTEDKVEGEREGEWGEGGEVNMWGKAYTGMGK